MCLLMGVVFWVVPVPVAANKHLANYRISLKILSVDYFVMSLLNLYLILFVWDQPFIGYFNFVRVLIGSSQTYLFTFVMLNLLDPHYVTFKRLYRNILILLIFGIAYIFSRLIYGDFEIDNLANIGQGFRHPTMTIRILFFVYFVTQLGYYSYLLYCNVRKFENEIENYFSDTHQLSLKSFMVLFIALVVFGIMAMLFILLPFRSCNFILTIVSVIFYFLFAVKFINYPKLFVLIEQAIYPEPESDSAEITETDDTRNFNAQHSRSNWNSLKKTIIDEKYYLKEQITLEEMAQALRISRNTLSSLINTEEKQNFYAWINALRIEQTKILFREHPDYTIGQIAQLTGFTETSNFSRTFKKVTGQTPSNWRTVNL
jgi:AraC-like DNA-binding protein